MKKSIGSMLTDVRNEMERLEKEETRLHVLKNRSKLEKDVGKFYLTAYDEDSFYYVALLGINDEGVETVTVDIDDNYCCISNDRESWPHRVGRRTKAITGDEFLVGFDKALEIIEKMRMKVFKVS